MPLMCPKPCSGSPSFTELNSKIYHGLRVTAACGTSHLAHGLPSLFLFLAVLSFFMPVELWDSCVCSLSVSPTRRLHECGDRICLLPALPLMLRIVCLSAFVCLGCHDKIPQTPWLTKTEPYFLTVLEPRSPRSRCHQGYVWWGHSSWLIDSAVSSHGLFSVLIME